MTASASDDPGDSPLVLYNWDPTTQLANYLTLQAEVAAGVPGVQVNIVALGDSTTAGFGGTPSDTDYRGTVSYPTDLATDLNAAGINANSDSFLGGGANVDGRLALLGGAYWSGAYGAGGQAIETQAAGDGVTFTLTSPGSFNAVSIDYLDDGSGALDVAVDGGPTIAVLQLGNSGQTLTQTVDLPAGSYSSLTVTAASATPTYIEGASFSNTATAAVEVYNAGEGGTTAADAVGAGVTAGIGELPGVIELSPSLALIDYGINDILDGVPAATTVANIGTLVTDLRAAGSDVIVIIPNPIESSAYAFGIAALRTDLQALSNVMNFPIIDLSATYGDDWAALNAAGLISDYAHPNATLYADIAADYSALLTDGTAPIVDKTAAPVVGIGGTAVLGTAAAGENNDALSVTLTADADFAAGSSVSLVAGSLIYQPGGAGAVGTDTVSYTVTDDVTGVSNEETQSVVLAGSEFEPACFVAGTLIRTPGGAAAVEALRPGDLAMTLPRDGGAPEARPVVWVGRRRIHLTRHPRPLHVWPVRVCKAAFGPLLPDRDLLLSPDHAVFVDGLLIPIRRLLNGSTIRQERRDSVTYYHVELDRYAILLAENLPAESYRDSGNRWLFENATGPMLLHPDLSGAVADRADAAPPDAAVAAVWRRLQQRARGWQAAAALPRAVRDPALRLAAVGRRIQPPLWQQPQRYMFALPPHSGTVEIVSRAAPPTALRPWLDDRRLLGVPLQRIVVRTDDGEQEVALDHPGLQDGWHDLETAPGRQWRWTDGRARLPLPQGARTVELHLAITPEYPAEAAVTAPRTADINGNRF